MVRVMTDAGGATKAAAPVGPVKPAGITFGTAPSLGSQFGTVAPAATKIANTGNPAPYASPSMSFPQNAAPQQNANSAGGGGVGVSDTGQVSSFATGGKPSPMSNNDWWNQDANYQAELAGYAASLAAAKQALSANRTQYDTDYLQTLKNLGWSSNGLTANDAATADQGGNWDPNNMLGAYGQGYNNLRNDYAGRGLMTSSFYGDALGNFGTDFNNQLKNLVGQRQNSVNNQNSQEQQALNDYTNAQTRARQSSLARAAAQGISIF